MLVMRVPHLMAAVVLVAGLAGGACAQLQQSQVLVVYDSTSADSLAVAEYYAGSAKVAGGVGGLVGARPGVGVVDLAGLTATRVLTPDVTWGQFVAGVRNPLRAWLNSNDRRGRVRCIVLTKGLAHRILDTDNPNVGEDFSGPGPGVVTELSAGDSTYSSVDSELTLLQQNVEAGENGGGGDSLSDGMIINPYFGSSVPFGAFSTASRKVARAFVNPVSGFPRGLLWQSSALTAGDMYLVTRLDGASVQAVRGLIDRAQVGIVDTSSAVFVLDESRSNGVADGGPNNELDNQDFATSPTPLWRNDDYESARDALVADGRFAPVGVRYDSGPFPSNYFFGPRVDPGVVLPRISVPITVLASEGANSDGTPGGLARAQLPDSFLWGPMGFYSTIESFNGRDFGGKGVLFSHSQVAGAVGAGCTFAVGNCWEPFAPTIAHNEVFIRRFYLGSMSFAEAAWASVPALSWQQVVVGDPLARVVRSGESVDAGDAGVNIDDMYQWEWQPVDINRDGQANGTDRRLIESSMRPGAGVLDMVGVQR